MGRRSKKSHDETLPEDENSRRRDDAAPESVDASEDRIEDGEELDDDSEPIELSEIDVLRAEIERANEERELFEEKLKHALADMSNMRRRASEDAVRAREQAVGRVTQEILPVLDAFELALASEGDRAALIEGVRMVHAMLEDLLGRHGVEVIAAMDTPFDPKFHEAIATEEREDVPSGTVVAVHQAGYRLRDRVLRPARVVVSSSIDTSNKDDDAGGEQGESRFESDAYEPGSEESRD